jgi:hypothetical protein
LQSRGLALAAAVLAAGALASACGVPVATSPDVLAASSVPLGLLSPPPGPFKVPKTPKGDFDIFLVDSGGNGQLVAVARSDESKLSIQVALTSLVQGPNRQEVFGGLGSDLPPGVPLQAKKLNRHGVVTINLGQNFGENLPPRAIAQMVWTVFQVRGVTGVLIEENGSVVSAPTQSGAAVDRPLTPADYTDYYP